MLRELMWEVDSIEEQESNAERDENVKTEPLSMVRKSKGSNRNGKRL